MKSRLHMAVIAIAAVLVLAIGIAPTAVAKPAKDYDKSVVFLEITVTGKVTYREPSGEIKESDALKSSSWCTGEFITTHGDILTAGHCIDEDMARSDIESTFNQLYTAPGGGMPMDIVPLVPGAGGAIPPSLLFPPTPNVEIVAIKGIYGQGLDFDITVSQLSTPGGSLSSPAKADLVATMSPDEGDLGLLKLRDASIMTHPLPIAAVSPDDLTEIIVMGYPGVIHQDVTDNAKDPQVQSQRVTKIIGNVSAHQPGECGFPCLEVSASLLHGMSGGPAVNAKTGEIVGVNSRFSGDGAANLYYVVDTPVIRDFLASHGVSGDDETMTEAQLMQPVYADVRNMPVPQSADDVASVRLDSVEGVTVAIGIVSSVMLVLLLTTVGMATFTRRFAEKSSGGRHRLPAKHQPLQ